MFVGLSEFKIQYTLTQITSLRRADRTFDDSYRLTSTAYAFCGGRCFGRLGLVPWLTKEVITKVYHFTVSLIV